jgi:hypothetical protein
MGEVVRGRHFERSATQSRTRRLSEAKSVSIDLSPESSGLRFSRDDEDFQTKTPKLGINKNVHLFVKAKDILLCSYLFV